MPVFRYPDGIEFSSKSEYREYMMNNFYSIKNKSNETNPIIKHPGSIDGQVFEIADCSDCVIVIFYL